MLVLSAALPHIPWSWKGAGVGVVVAGGVLTMEAWRDRQAAHHRRIDDWLGAHLAKRSRHGRHSIDDFLFTYYSYRPAQLRRWHPGHGVALEGAEVADFGPRYANDDDGRLRVDVDSILARQRASIGWIYRLLAAIAGRAPHFGCFGMHEWAMVYQQAPSETRHNILPLRLGGEVTTTVVEEIKIKCSHFDAFRFFTPPARRLNSLQPTRDAQAENEQPGCLQANMDVYRWAYKLSPLVPSELIADCFGLARDIRTLDMRASPYDLTGLGLDPVRVETPEGRVEYVRHQRDFAKRAAVLRGQLIAVCTSVLEPQDRVLR